MRDDDLAIACKLNLKELHKLVGKLKDDRLVKSFQRSEARTPTARPVPRTYYCLDYRSFIDVTKWRMYRLRQIVSDRMQKERNSRGYICPKCQRCYDTLEAQLNLDPKTMMFICEDDHTELVENESSTEAIATEAAHSLLMEQSASIIALLKQTDETEIKPFNAYAALPPLVPVTRSGDDGAYYTASFYISRK